MKSISRFTSVVVALVLVVLAPFAIVMVVRRVQGQRVIPDEFEGECSCGWACLSSTTKQANLLAQSAESSRSASPFDTWGSIMTPPGVSFEGCVLAKTFSVPRPTGEAEWDVLTGCVEGSEVEVDYSHWDEFVCSMMVAPDDKWPLQCICLKMPNV